MRTSSGLAVILLVLLPAILHGTVSDRRLSAAGAQDPLIPPGEEVAADGLTTIPFDPIAWRVVRDTATDAGSAAFLERALGFAIADQGNLIVSDQAGGLPVTVDQGDAAFIPEAAIQQHASAAGEPVPYLRIGLVPPPDATFTAGAELVLAGEGFDAPVGERRLVLFRHQFTNDDDIVVESTGVPSLVVVTAGTVEVQVDAGVPRTVEAGGAAEFDGDLTLARSGVVEATAFVAVIDEPAPANLGTVAAGDAQVRVYARGCPPDEPEIGAGFIAYDSACDEPIEGARLNLTAEDQEESQTTQLDVATPNQGIAVWTDIVPGDVAIVVPDLPGYGAVAVFCRNEGDDEPPRPVQNLGFQLEPGDELACHLFYRPAETDVDPGNATSARGRITIQMRRCAPGVAASDLPAARARCAEDFDALQLALLGGDLDGQLRNTDWVEAVAGMAWADLSLGEYRIVYAPPNAAVILTETDPNALGAPTTSTATTYPVTLSPDNPEVILVVYVFSS